MMRDILKNTQAAIGIMCIIMMIVSLVGGGFFTWYLMENVVKVGVCLIVYIIIPIIVMIVLAIIVKRYLLGGKK